LDSYHYPQEEINYLIENILFALDKKIINMFLKFLIIGSLVFLLDYLIYQSLIFFFSLFVARFLSYSFATWVAWRLNSKYNFANRSGTFLNYYVGASLAGIQNVLISSALMHTYGSGYMMSFLFIGLGSIYGLFFNFFMQLKITYKNYKD
jgi:hypothetical protein